MMGMGFGMMGLSMLVFWGLLILLAVWLVKALFQGSQTNQPPTGQEPTPREILDRRYAQGEINREQYEIMKKDLA